MLDWITGIEQFFNELSTSINDLINDMDQMIASINSFMNFSMIYMAISGTVLVLLLFLLIKTFSKLNLLEQKIDFIYDYYKEEEEDE